MDETSLFWKRTPERTIIHKEARSAPGFKVCVSTLYNVCMTMHFSERIPVIKRCMTVLYFKVLLYSIWQHFSWWNCPIQQWPRMQKKAVTGQLLTVFISWHLKEPSKGLKQKIRCSLNMKEEYHPAYVISCLNSGSSYLGCGTLPILTQLTKSISHGSYVTTQLLNGFCISGQRTFRDPLWVLEYLSDTFLTHTSSQSQWVLQTAEIKAEDSNLQGSYVLLLDE